MVRLRLNCQFQGRVDESDIVQEVSLEATRQRHLLTTPFLQSSGITEIRPAVLVEYLDSRFVPAPRWRFTIPHEVCSA